MPNRNYLAGRRFEYRAMQELKECGYTVMRTAGSHGPFDIIAIHTQAPHVVEMVQCKIVDTPAAASRMEKHFRKNPPFLVQSKFVQSLAMWVRKSRERRWVQL